MSTSNKQRQANYKARQKQGGFTRGDVYAHPDDWPKIRKLEKELRDKREGPD